MNKIGGCKKNVFGLVYLTCITGLIIAISSCGLPKTTVTIVETGAVTTTTQLITQTSITTEVITTTNQGNSDNYHSSIHNITVAETYSFPVYIHNDETLHLFVGLKSYSKGDLTSYLPLRLDMLTPSGVYLHSYGIWSQGEYANGTLCEYASQPFAEYTTQFSPSDYDWGEGYYRFTIRSDYADSPVEFVIEYWIEG